MKKLILSILVFSCITVVNAQVTYSIIPAKNLTVTAASNSITIFDIFQKNIGAAKIVLKWKGISVNLPGTWQYSMCDFGTCYPGIPNGPNTMDTIPVNGQGFLGLNIDPGSTDGTGIVKVYVYQKGFPNSGDTLTWYVKTIAASVEELTASSEVKVYPNPAKDNLFIKSGNNNIVQAELFDAVGRKVLTTTVNGDSNINISGLDNGFYSLIITCGDKRMMKRIIKE